MWVKGIPLHFVVDNENQNKLISAEVMKRLELPTTPHPQPYNIGRLSQGRGIHISHQCFLPYGIKPFKDDVLCVVDQLEVCGVIESSSLLMTSAKIGFFWFSLSTTKCSGIPFTHICEWKRRSFASDSLGSFG